MSTALLDPPAPQIDDDGTRREFVVGGLTLAALLAGCGEEPDVRETGAGFPRSARHTLGTTRLSGFPDRVVAIVETYELEALLTLGVVPVLAGTYTPAQTFRPWVRDAIARLGKPLPERLDLSSGVDVETVAAARPDLIVGDTSAVGEAYAQLAGVAPTFTLDVQNLRGWQAFVRPLSGLLGRRERAERALRGLQAEAAGARRRVRLEGTTVGIVADVEAEGLVRLFGADDPQSQWLQTFGARNVRSGELVDNFSVERLGVLREADVLVTLDFGSGGDPTRSALFRQLPAAQAGRVVRLTADQSFSLFPINELRLPAAVAVAEAVAAA